MLEDKLFRALNWQTLASRQNIWVMIILAVALMMILGFFASSDQHRTTTIIAITAESLDPNSRSQQESVIQEPIGVISNPGSISTVDRASYSLEPAKKELTADERYLLALNPKHYVLQIIALPDEKKLQVFRVITGLKNKAYYYQTVHQNKPWYVLIYGDYPNRQEAMRAIAELSAHVKEQNPDVRLAADIGSAIYAQYQ